MIPLGVIPLGDDSPGGRFPWGTIPLGDDSPGGRFPKGKDPPWPNGRGRGSRFLAVAGSNPPPLLGVTLVSLWGHLGVILGSLWGHLGIILGSLWDHFGIILGSCWDQFGVMLGSFLAVRTGRSPERGGRQNGQTLARTAPARSAPARKPDWKSRQVGQNARTARTPERQIDNSLPSQECFFLWESIA